ncbi:MAG: DUF3467 domain-containing protein, partial [Planctomycetes bacterium]|nr:DUF3467 domain-containing protein [Planctomycetota bacterium]
MMSDGTSRGGSEGAGDVGRGPEVIEKDGLQATYANFVRVSGTPEELVLDFGLNSQPTGALTTPIKIDQRLVLNHYTAKRLWLALGASLQR